MLGLTNLHNLLVKSLHPPTLHTAVLISPTGDLISYASKPTRCKDEIHVIVGVAGELWQETRGKGIGMVDSELGRITVLPIDDKPLDSLPQPLPDDYQPLMLLVLNSTDAMSWEDLQATGTSLTSHLAKTLGRFREHLAVAKLPILPQIVHSPTYIRP